MSWVDPFIGGMASLLGTGLGYLSQQSTNKANAQINRESLQAAKDMQERNLSYQTDMWNKTNEYNSPVNQARLYREAGFNPYAMMGENFQPAQMQSGSQGSVPGSIPMQSYQPNFDGVADAVHGYYDTRIKQEQADMLKYQNDVKENEYYMKIAQQYADLREKQNKSDIDRMLLRKYESELRVALASEKFKIQQNKSDAAYASAQADTADWNYFWQRMTSDLDYQAKQLGVSNMTQVVRRSEAEVESVWADVALKHRQGMLTDKSIEEASQRIASIMAENAHNKKLFPLIRREVRSKIWQNYHVTRRQGPAQFDSYYDPSDNKLHIYDVK